LQDHLSYFRFVGRIIGLAVMHGLHISGGFTLPLHRLLLGKKITLSDIETVDPDLHRSFVWILYVTSVQLLTTVLEFPFKYVVLVTNHPSLLSINQSINQ